MAGLGPMRRRDFISRVAGLAAGWPLAARAQQGERARRIGMLTAGEEGNRQIGSFLQVFKRGLQELGWIEGRNIQVDYRFGANDTDRMQRFAKELVNAQPDVIVGHTTPAAAA